MLRAALARGTTRPKKEGKKTGILSRGYKGEREKDPFLVRDENKILANPSQSGDEAYLHALNLKVPVVVSRNRVEGAKFLKEKFNVDVIVMDDELFLNEIVEVVAVFQVGHRPCRPVKFRRQSGREVLITKIGLGYAHERGARTTHIFDVTDGQADYRLEFDSVTLVWRLVREADHV